MIFNCKNHSWEVWYGKWSIRHWTLITHPHPPLQVQQSCIFAGDPQRAEWLRRPAGAHCRKHDDGHLCGAHQVPPGAQTRTENSERGGGGGEAHGRGWGQGGEKGREKGTGKFGRLQIDSGRLCHPVTSQHIHCNLFLPQHLADAKKAQQTLESSFKHLESVSQLVLLLTDVCDSSLKINSPKLLKNMQICFRMKPDFTHLLFSHKFKSTITRNKTG